MERTPLEVLTLEELGWSDALAGHVPAGSGLAPARVASVYAARVDVWTREGPRLASLRSRALRDAEGGVAVGDWALVARAGADTTEVVVEAILPRRTAFLRQAAGERAEPQAIAANVDRVFVVTSVEGDVNVRRLERYLVAIAAGGAEAQIVLTKADLVEDIGLVLERVGALAPAFATSARDGRGVDELLARIPRGTTATVVGSSGVGKSALVNRLLGRDVQLEGAVRAYDGRGRHTTTRRELFVLPGGGLLIDTPGMRELKPWLPEGSLDDDTFDDVAAFAGACRYRDCGHAREPGCAVRAALEAGELSEARLTAWQKLSRERAERAERQASFAAVTESRRRARTNTLALRKRLKDKGR
ncbi:MAG: ribosome small subunit-dependent GTPase A [Labilithrix sp.]|nr:ribosome small subunit-dependent GTPase A [Labilithrix sp.]MBX3218030.1 ribosome small subunit-dependent GTPase A [Labilithrix sp.]